jgi:hypothetical protein
MPIEPAEFTIRVIGPYSPKERSDNWRAALIVRAMEGCAVDSIIKALRTFEENRTVKVGDPSRWLSHFAGLEIESSGKAIPPWIEITFKNRRVLQRTRFRDLIKKEAQNV